jgi:RNA polymerase sigma-70 factor (ECF subfamily)
LRLFGRKNLSKLTDEQLLSDYRRAGQREILGELYKRYTHLVLGIGMKYFKDADDAADLVMQVFEKLLVELRSTQVEHFRAWLCTLSRNECLMELRKRKTRLARESDYGDLQDQHMESDEALHLVLEQAQNGQLAKLEAAMLQLNEHQKRCIDLFYLQKQSYQEVADQTGYSIKQVKSYLQNGKRNLKKLILAQGPDQRDIWGRET